jgi:hypothetical protein
MPRTASVLSVAALAGATLGFATAAFADSAAQVGPSSVSPGGSVTVSVACESTGGPPPATIDATSQAFDEGTVQLQRVTGAGDEDSGPAYRGTARIAPADDLQADGLNAGSRDAAWTVDGTCAAAPGGKGKAWSATFHVNRDAGDGGGHGGDTGGGGGGQVGGGGGGQVGGGDGGHVGDGGGGDLGGAVVGGVGGHDEGRPCTEQGPDSCGDAGMQEGMQDGTQDGMQEGMQDGMQHGVQAGAGGTFSDSVPALVAGGILIAGALGAAAYRLRHRGSVWGR